MDKKSIFPFVLVGLFISGCFRTKEELITLQGRIINSNPQTIYVSRIYLNGKPDVIIDSIPISKLDTDYLLKIPTNSDSSSLLKLNIDRNAAFLYLDDKAGNKKLDINMIDLQNYFIEGNALDQDLNRIYQILRPVSDSLFIINNFLHQDNFKNNDSLHSIYKRLKREYRLSQIQFALDSTKYGKVAIKIAYEMEQNDLADYKMFLLKLKNKFPTESIVKNYITQGEQYVYIMEHEYHIGDTITDIELNLFGRNKARFKDILQNENVLVFWASYSPNSLTSIKELMRNPETGRQIITVSLDPDSVAYIETAKNFPLTWYNTYDFRSWQGALAMHFLVKDIPSSYVISKEAVILEKN